MDERNDSDLLATDLIGEEGYSEDQLLISEVSPDASALDDGELDDGELGVGENEDHILEEGRRLLAAAEAKLASVERALERLDSGNYGNCEVCGVAIAPALLVERPSLARCSAHGQA